VTRDDTGGGGAVEAAGLFVGTFIHALDPKKRLTIPSEWREQVGQANSLYVLPAVDQKCLCVFRASDMVSRLQRIRSHSIADTRARQFARILGSQSQLVPWDSQGRIRVKDELLATARLTDQVALVGAFEGFELWNPELWKACSAEGPASLAEVARYVGF
jgi:MraZ protein